MPRAAAPIRRRSKLRPQFEPLEGRALLSRASLPSAQFSWSMPERFGIDQQTIHYDPTTGVTTLTPGPDGVIDYNYSQSYVNPTTWELDLSGSTSSGGKAGRSAVPISDYTFIVDGKAYDAGSSPAIAVQVPDLGAHTVTEVVTAADGRKATTTQRVVMKDVVIVSLGDSYASGEGNPDVPMGTDASGPVWENARTELSANAAPAQMALAIERSDPHSSVTFLSFADAGASISEGLLGPADGINPPTGPHAPLPSQLDQVLQVLYPHGTSPAAHPRPIDALLVSVGGNDIGFTGIAEADLDPQLAQLSDQPGLVSQLNANLQALPALYDQLGTAIRADFPGLVKHVDLTEYPDPTHNASGGFSAGTGLYSGFTAAKARWTYQHVEVPLQTEMRQAAARNGWVYVGGIAAGSRRHGITATQSWFVDPIQSLFEQGNIDGTLHPNAQGQQFIRDRLLAAVRPRLSFKGRR